MTRSIWAALAAVGAIALPVSAVRAEEQDPAKVTVVHVATGFHFPATVEGFKRVSINSFNASSTDINVSYASLTPGAQIAVTVYITPAPAVIPDNAAVEKSCGDQFAAMDRRFTRVHPGARQLVFGPTKSPSPVYSGTGKQVIYDYEDLFYGQKQTLRSETDLYCYVGGDWLIAFRTTAPVMVDYGPKLAGFMHALAWPLPGAGKPVAVDDSSPAPPAPPAPAPVAMAPPPAPAPAPAAAVGPIPNNRVLVRLKAGKAQAALAGLVVAGTDADLGRFEAAASQHGVDARRMTESGQNESIASLLKPGIKLADASDLFRRTRDGKFGKLKLDVMLLPPDAAGDERDLLSRAAIVPAGALETF